MKFKQLQEQLNLSKQQCADLFAVSSRCIEKWRVENPPAPKAVIMCLKYRVKHGEFE